MTAIEFAKGTVGLATEQEEISSVQTISYPKQRKSVASPAPPTQTSPWVEDEERGDVKELAQDGQAHLPGNDRPLDMPDDSGEASRKRSELARKLLDRFDQLAPFLGTLSLPTHLELLKKTLASCHKELQQYPSESNFLSLVTLVESAMVNLKWQQYTQHHLDLFRKAFDVGYRKLHVRFQDYDQVRRLFSSGKVEALPQMGLESLSLEDLEDDEED